MSTSSSPYVPLHLRSYFSLLRGCRSPEELCAHAAGAGFPAAGLADINNLYGAVRFITAARREGIKPIIGAAVEYRKEYLFTAYCLTKRGFGRLNRLLTGMFMDEEYDPVAISQVSDPVSIPVCTVMSAGSIASSSATICRAVVS